MQGALWQRKGWKEMDKMRAQLEDLRELRDLVRSLGRGGGWGPLRRAPVQYLDMKGRPGLLRTILEQQETRGLTRSDDISRLLPSEVGSSYFLAIVGSSPKSVYVVTSAAGFRLSGANCYVCSCNQVMSAQFYRFK